MPEGPEVKYIANSLNNIVNGMKIKSLKIYSGRYLRHGPPDGYQDFLSHLNDNTVTLISVNVHGKFIWWKFSGGWYLLNTLGMSGQWLVSDLPTNHCHIGFVFEGDINVWYRDIRNFGTLRFVNNKSKLDNCLGKLGSDILSKHGLSRSEWDKLVLDNRFLNITVFLMSQNKLAGVGNYLKAEALYQENINPMLTLDMISQDDLWNLYLTIREIAKRSYMSHGASFHSYLGPKGEKGSHGFKFMVYGRKKDNYGHIVERITTPDGRTTYWVPMVQC